MCQYCPLISKILAEEEFLSGNSDLTASNCTKDDPERWYKKTSVVSTSQRQNT